MLLQDAIKSYSVKLDGTDDTRVFTDFRLGKFLI